MEKIAESVFAGDSRMFLQEGAEDAEKGSDSAERPVES